MNDISDEGDQTPTVPNKKASRSTKEREESRKNRNLGLEYIDSNGNLHKARQRKPVKECKRRKCQDIITDELGDIIFQEYWSQGSYNKRKAYVISRMEYDNVARKRKRDPDSTKSKEVSWKYFLEVRGVRHQVCKDTFLNTLDESDTFVRTCGNHKRDTVTGIVAEDKRGKHKPKHSLKEDTVQQVIQHIQSFPAYESHYCRKQSQQKYFARPLSKSIMLKKYNKKYPKISKSTFLRIFKPLGYKFKPPASDTCGLCDELTIKIKVTVDEEEKNKLKRDKELHLRKAEAAYDLKRQFKEEAKRDNTKSVLIFDLQQCLPTPDIKCGEVYYARQLYTYNLTIHDPVRKITYNYMWNEAEGFRGANEIASCIFYHVIEYLPPEVLELILFSDACSGQNRNSIVAAMFHVLLQMHETLRKIQHIFLIRGHTRLECDSQHSVIEQARKTADTVNVPSEWYQLVEGCGESVEFKVIQMKDNFFDFSRLMKPDGPLVMRDKKDNGQKFYWTKTHWFQYSKDAPGCLKVRSSFNGEFDSYNMIRGHGKNRRLMAGWYDNIPGIEGSKPIAEAKKQDLLRLLKYLDIKYHAFYQNLTTDSTLRADLDPDLPSEDEDAED